MSYRRSYARCSTLTSDVQLYEFLTPVESAICVAYHPQQNQLALGFASGKIRIIDIASTTMIVSALALCHPFVDS